MVQDVEELAPEAKTHLLRDAKDSLQADIGLRGVETPQHIAPEIALLAGGAAVNAPLLKILPPGYPPPNSSRGTPGTKFGRGFRAMPFPLNCASTTSTGRADRATTNASSDHPPKIARTAF